MSLIAGLFGWTGLPKILQELLALGGTCIAVALVAGYIHHRIYTDGIAAQQAADQVASAKVEAQAAAATKAAQDAANHAEESYREEIAHNAAVAAAQPLPSISLCVDSYAGGPSVPEASAPHPGDEGAGAGPGGVREVPAGNPDVRGGPGPDISGLLDLLARRADDGSAVEREFQARGAH